MIPLVYSIGVLGFFLLLPEESITLNNFIGYMSSLSTVTMVLIVIYTNSLQIDGMNLQLKEMKDSRLLQTQPLPLIKPLSKSFFEKPRFFYTPPENKTTFNSRVIFYFEMENVGNASAIAIDRHIKINFFDKNKNAQSVSPIWDRIESLKPNEKNEWSAMIPNKNFNVAECIMRNFILGNELSTIDLTIYYRNLLGATFREKISFEIWPYEEDGEKLKACIKLLDSTRLDCQNDMREIERLRKLGNIKDARKILKELNEKIIDHDDCISIKFFAEPIRGSFEISRISEANYREQLEGVSYPHRVSPPSKNKNGKGQCVG